MKDSIKTIMLTIIAFSLLTIAIYAVHPIQQPDYCAERYYAKTATATAINGDIVEFEDENGNIWEWEGSKSWEIGQLGSLLMDDNGTQSIYDDIIVKINHSGTAEMFIKN